MAHRVWLSRLAIDDLKRIAEWIADEAGTSIALAYVDRIRVHCDTLAEFPARGRPRRGKGIRSIPFRRSATILYRVSRGEVLILRIVHSGRDIDRDIAAIA